MGSISVYGPPLRAISIPSTYSTNILFTTCLDYHRNRFENQLTAEREATLRYKGENGIMKKKFTVLTKDIEDQKVNLTAAETGVLLAFLLARDGPTKER